MEQSKRHSLIEVILNVGSGMILAFLISQLAHIFAPEIRQYIWSGFTWELSASSNAIVTVLLTAASIIRSYIWRRVFNRIQRKQGNRNEVTEK